ncbi:hypothetical protein [Draconibacterium orientale]|uniref:hypothetical protein n=1 Tax=Draconibacterium orientale TaxID=1168034 RepID=UPI0029BFC1A2|nr:hypothetical protein [Draconibacterium orientale]
MEDIIIKDKGDHIAFFSSSLKEFYWIEDTALTLLEQNQVSRCITDLMLKKWIKIDQLYVVAQIIQTKYPKSEIDWVETFLVVERYCMNHNTNIILNEKSEDGIYDSAMMARSTIRMIHLNQERDEKVEEDLIKLVKRNLKTYGF